MKTLAAISRILIVAVVFYCCKEQDENLPRIKGKILFSPEQVGRSDGRINEQAKAAFVYLSLKDSAGNAIESLKLSLFTLGQGFITENFEMETGNYYLTEFIVLDSSSNVIYATPLEGSGLAKYVDDPLPIEFKVGNGETRIKPQVLAVQPTDDSELFGMVSFGFDIAPRSGSLNLRIHYPDAGAYDSAYIVFKNSGTEIKQKLLLNNSTYLASGIVNNFFPGSWNVSTSFFNTIQPNYESLEKNAVFTFDITSTATDLISIDGFAFLKDGKELFQKTFPWEEYYYYQLYLKSTKLMPEGFVRLPTDPTNPFVEIRTFEQKWIYAYVDRSFYNSSVDGTSNHYQGGGAFEIYGKYGDTYDRLNGAIIDTTSLAPGISDVANKEWNLVDGVIIIEGANISHELLLYHVWDFRSSSGRTNSTLETIWSEEELQRRKQIHRR